MKIWVGDFTEDDLKNKVDKEVITNVQKKTGLSYTLDKIIKKNGERRLRVWVCDLETWANVPLEKELDDLCKGLKF